MTPDGLRMAYPCGGGNGAGYTVYDFDTDDLTISFGAWDTDAYPQSAWFSADSQHVVLTNTFDVKVFNVTTHIEEQTVVTGLDSLQTVAISRGSRIVYVIDEIMGDFELLWYIVTL